MLRLAATIVDDADDDASCPDAIQIAGYVDGTVGEADVAVLKSHIAACAACADLLNRLEQSDAGHESNGGTANVGGASGKSLRMWIAGAAMLAAAAAIALVVYLPRPALLALDVSVLAAGNTRSVDSSGGASELDIEISLRRPAWTTLLVVDSRGELTFLEEREIESAATLGRYSASSPGVASSDGRRRFVVALVSDVSLTSKLAALDIEPVTIIEDAEANTRAMADLCAALARRLDCEAHYAPIRVPDPLE